MRLPEIRISPQKLDDNDVGIDVEIVLLLYCFVNKSFKNVQNSRAEEWMTGKELKTEC